MLMVGEDETRKVVDGLFAHSQWFQIEPLPNDVWGISVKEENKALLHDLYWA